jgi:hypothetical protein
VEEGHEGLGFIRGLAFKQGVRGGVTCLHAPVVSKVIDLKALLHLKLIVRAATRNIAAAAAAAAAAA